MCTRDDIFIAQECKKDFIRKFAFILPKLIIVSVFFGLIVAFSIGRYDLFNRGLGIALPMIFASIVLIFIYTKELNINKQVVISSINETVITKLFFTIFFISIILLFIYPLRSWYYLIVLIILYIIIFIHVFLDKINEKLVQLEIIFLLLNVIYGITLKYPFYFGGTDIIPHMYMSEVTYWTGHVIPSSLSLYTDFPFYHILVSESSYLLGLSIQQSLFIITGIIYVSAVPFIYGIFCEFISNRQTCLLGCLFYAANSTVIYYGSYMVTRTLAFYIFLVILYLLNKKLSDKNIVTYRVLLVFFILYIVLVHQASLMQISLLLSILAACQVLIGIKPRINPLILFNVAFISYWFFVSYSFISDAITSLIFPSLTEPISISSTVNESNVTFFLLSNVDMFIFTFFAIIGVGYTLWSKQSQKQSVVLAFFCLVSLILYIPNPLLLLAQTADLLLFGRFVLLLSPFMSLIMAIGASTTLFVFKGDTTRKNKISIFVFLLVTFSFFTFTSLIYSLADSHDLYRDAPNEYFTDQELKSFEFIFDEVPTGSNLYSDYHTSKIFMKPDLYSETISFNSVFNSNIISYSENPLDKLDNGYIIFREGAFLDKGIYFGTDVSVQVYRSSTENKARFMNFSSKSNKIYSSSNVSLYLSKF